MIILQAFDTIQRITITAFLNFSPIRVAIAQVDKSEAGPVRLAVLIGVLTADGCAIRPWTRTTRLEGQISGVKLGTPASIWGIRDVL